MTCTAVTPELWTEFILFLVLGTSLFSVGTLLFGHLIWSGVIEPWITRRTSAATVELMHNEKKLARLVRMRARRLQQGQGGAEQ